MAMLERDWIFPDHSAKRKEIFSTPTSICRSNPIQSNPKTQQRKWNFTHNNNNNDEQEPAKGRVSGGWTLRKNKQRIYVFREPLRFSM